MYFSTGRGTPYGGFVPTVKIATNSELAAKERHWIDFDAGQLIHGKAMPQLLKNLSTPSLSLPTVNKPATSVTTSANWRSSKAA
ncbi:hypothetical protein ACLB1T_07280 [Escherichia coli]